MAKKKKQPAPLPISFKHIWWVVPLLAVLVYIPAFNADFTLDDILIVQDNMLIRSVDKLDDIWTSHYWAGKIDASDTGLYRPLTLTTYALQYLVHGANAPAFHIINILLHALTCFVLMRFVQLFFKNYQLTALSGLLFAIHPLHSEAVAGIVGRAEILAALFILLSAILYHKWRQDGNVKWLIGLIITSAAAVTSKEHGFMLPVILGLQEVFMYASHLKNKRPISRMWTGLGAVIIVCTLLWIVRSQITGPAKPHEEWLLVEASDRMATSVRTTVEYIGMHLMPLKLSADYWSKEVPVVGWGNIAVLLSLLLSLGIAALAIWQRKKIPAFSWGVLFFFVTLAPVSNFLFAAGFLKAERILYIPSIGLIIAISALLIRLLSVRNAKWPVIIFISVFSLFYFIKTLMRAGDWKNNYTLAEATLKVSPESPRFNNMMGLELRSQNRNEEALMFFEKSVQSNPNHVPALVNLGTEYKHFNRLDEAAATLEKALAIDPSTMATYVNLMSIYRDMGKYQENVAVAEKAVQKFPGSAAILWNAANAYHLINNMERANALRARAREIQPDIGK